MTFIKIDSLDRLNRSAWLVLKTLTYILKLEYVQVRSRRIRNIFREDQNANRKTLAPKPCARHSI
jgi:hypothetical protein